MLKNCIFEAIMKAKIWIKYTEIVEVLSLSRRHHKLVNKEFEEETKQEQGKYYLSEQLWAGKG